MAKILHKKSLELKNGIVKFPNIGDIDYGEFAINYATGNEVIIIKNDANELVAFSGDDAKMTLINNSFNGVQGHISSLSAAVETIIEQDYATSANVSTEIINIESSIPGESALISSGFVKNALTAVTVNNVSGTTNNGVLDVTLPMRVLPQVSSQDNNKILRVVNGSWAASELTPINLQQ